MKKLVRLLMIPLGLFVTNVTAGCSVSPKEVALITDIGDIDDGSFNQESWEAVKEYSNKNNKTYDFYRPFNDSDFARMCSVKQAVAKGAKVIVLPGFKFQNTCTEAAIKYPKIHFLLLDNSVGKGIENLHNWCAVKYRSEYSGFLAGYSIMTDLMRRDLAETGKFRDTYGYGYVGGMPIPGTYEFGFGYIQGICYAAKVVTDLNPNIAKPRININFNYAGVFAQSDAAAAIVKGWFSNSQGRDIKVVFPCGGKLYQSITEAAQSYNNINHYYDNWNDAKSAPREAARWVGVDSDQYLGLKYDYELKSIFTSALKGLKQTVSDALDYHFKNEWESQIGGIHANLDPKRYATDLDGTWTLGLDSGFGETTKITKNYVGIPDTDNMSDPNYIIRGFNNFSVTDYTNVCKDLSDQQNPIHIYPMIGMNEDGGIECGAKEFGNPMGMESTWVIPGAGMFRDEFLHYGQINDNLISIVQQ